MHIGLNKSVIKAGDAFVGGQNSWELGGVEMEFLRII